MALRFIAVSLAVAFVAQQASAGCIFEKLTHLSKAACQKGPITRFPHIPTPTKTIQHPDVEFTVALPEEIPIGNFCSCRKYGLVPKIVPVDAAPACAPAPAPVCAPAPAPAYAPVYAAAPAPAPAFAPSFAHALISGHGLGHDVSSFYPTLESPKCASGCACCH